MAVELTRESLLAERPVWPLAQRLAHWALALATIVALVSGLWLPEWYLPLHVAAGVTAGLALLFRLVAGLVGPPPFAFDALPISWEALHAHLRALLHRRAPGHLAHNPLGSVMVVALLATCALLVSTGLVVWGGQEKSGPLAALTGYDLARTARPWHVALAWVMLVLVAGHLLGVLVESRLARESLILAMLTGRKPFHPGAPDARALMQADPQAHVRATVAGAVAAAVALLGGAVLTTLPPRGFTQVHYPRAYLEECGACHDPYHPSLLPADRWDELLAGLDDHFGEDASLDASTTEEIRRFLVGTAAFAWDTEAAREIRASLPDDGLGRLRMTASSWWRMRHGRLDDAWFRSPDVGGRINCGGCHGDALTGLFADGEIRLPALSARGRSQQEAITR